MGSGRRRSWRWWGRVNLPIIVFSVQWWNTLHQGNTISFSGGSKIYITMLYPLLIASVGFYLCFLTLVAARMCAAIMERRNAEFVAGAGGPDDGGGGVNLAPFIDGSYGVTVVFLVGIGVATWARYRRAVRRLRAVETR